MACEPVIPFSRPLREVFGGAPNWLAARVPAGQEFDLEVGSTNGPAGRFIRSPGSNRWVAAS